jgi:apolipoprotein N-acyltransferase
VAASSAAWRLRALGALSGVVYFLAFPTYSLGPLAWVAFIPLFAALRRAPRRREALWIGAAAGMAISVGGYFWIADTAHRFWQVPWPLAILLLGIFGTFAELHVPVFAGLLWTLRRRFPSLPAAGAAALFAVCELYVPRIFPDKLAHPTLDLGTFAYAAALVGTHGLSFTIAWTAAALEAAWATRRDAAHRRHLVELGLAAVAVLALAAWGARQRAALTAAPAAKTLEILLVQSNVGDPEELAKTLGNVTQAIDSTVSTYIGLTAQALARGRADLVVWPETAVPAIPRPRVVARVQSLVAAYGVPIVFGAYDAERVAGKRLKMYNAAFHMTANGELTARYYKHKLLLFGEYVPLSDRFPALLDLLPTPGEFTPGPGPGVFRIAGVAFTPLICYELLFPSVVRGALDAGGEVVLNLTNDYWFGRHLEPEQHLALCRMCAMETGRPIVRATNTGITALVDARGEVVARTGIWTQETLRARLAVPAMRWTPYARWGETALAVLVAAALLAVGVMWRLVPRREPPWPPEPSSKEPH